MKKYHFTLSIIIYEYNFIDNKELGCNINIIIIILYFNLSINTLYFACGTDNARKNLKEPFCIQSKEIRNEKKLDMRNDTPIKCIL